MSDLSVGRQLISAIGCYLKVGVGFYRLYGSWGTCLVCWILRRLEIGCLWVSVGMISTVSVNNVYSDLDRVIEVLRRWCCR